MAFSRLASSTVLSRGGEPSAQSDIQFLNHVGMVSVRTLKDVLTTLGFLMLRFQNSFSNIP